MQTVVASRSARVESDRMMPIVMPNAELTGRRRVDALPARRRICRRRLAGKVASRWRSG